MIARLFRRGGERAAVIRTLHGRVIAAARAPALYTALGVPDTIEGRFEALCLHAILVLRRLRGLPAPAPEVAQELVDSVFRQLDASLREMGIGDFGVPKRMKKLAQSFYGRASAYEPGLAAADPVLLAAPLARNVMGSDEPGTAAGLAAYVLAAGRALGAQDLDALLGPGPHLPDPMDYAGEAETAASGVRP
jgi:cytochrome b pre-mRNA-processing protein 3